MAKQDDYVRITLRIPKELHAQLAEASEGEAHSLNAEIIKRLQDSFRKLKLNLDSKGNFEGISEEEIQRYMKQAADDILKRAILNFDEIYGKDAEIEALKEKYGKKR